MAIAVSGLVVSFIACTQLIKLPLPFVWEGSKTKIAGSTGNANYLGADLIFPIFALTALFLRTVGKRRILWGCLLLAPLGVMIFSKSRSAWIGLFIAGTVFFYGMKRIHGISIIEWVKAQKKQIMIW
jgi:hypothetical protein